MVFGCSKPQQDAQPVATATATPTASAPAPAPSGTIARRSVKPSDTDPATKQAESDHVVMVPAAGNGQKLLVFLPGTNGKTDKVSLFLETAAESGYLVVSLDYPDKDAAAECKNEVGCFADMREEIIEGVDKSPKVNVGPADSITHRLVALLDYEAKTAPNEGWSAFVANGQPAYEKIAFAGHSQGGGHAAFIAKKHQVARVLMFSSVCDALEQNGKLVAASWVNDHVTPIERYWGFDHVKDKFATHIEKTWPAMGMEKTGLRTSVDGAAAPYGGSHQLTTAIPEKDGQNAHTCVVTDGLTPKGADGTPAFKPVWRVMLNN